MASLRGDVKRLKELLTTSKSAISSLALEDGTVAFKLAMPGACIRVSAVFTDPDEYPNSGVCLLCDDNEEAAVTLTDLQERFESRAPLESLLSKVGGARGRGRGRADPRPARR
jgi:hypothetical protein